MQFYELCCLSEPGYVDVLEEYVHKYGSITRMWIGPYLAVFLSDAKYVEVSKLSLDL